MVTWRPVEHQRVMMLLRTQGTYCFSLPLTPDSPPECWVLNDLHFPKRKVPSALVDQTVVEAELVMDKEKAGSNTVFVPRLMLVDVLAFEGFPLFKEVSLEKRLQCLDIELIAPRKKKDSSFDHSKSPAMVR